MTVAEMASAVQRSRLFTLRKNCFLRVYVLLNEVRDLIEEEKSRRKRLWVRAWIGRRNRLGASALLLKELAAEDVKEYRMCLRMSPHQFTTLLGIVGAKIQKQDTHMRDAIPPQLKLEVTLNFLATGNSYRSLQQFFRVSKPLISKFIPEVCVAIYESLQEYIKVSL